MNNLLRHAKQDNNEIIKQEHACSEDKKARLFNKNKRALDCSAKCRLTHGNKLFGT